MTPNYTASPKRGGVGWSVTSFQGLTPHEEWFHPPPRKKKIILDDDQPIEEEEELPEQVRTSCFEESPQLKLLRSDLLTL